MHPRRRLENHTRTDPCRRRQGYYWPNLQRDAKEFSQKCPQCQIYSNIPRQPAAPLYPITRSWPFSMWGLDFLGPFLKSGRNLRHVLLATDYFSKRGEGDGAADGHEHQELHMDTDHMQVRRPPLPNLQQRNRLHQPSRLKPMLRKRYQPELRISSTLAIEWPGRGIEQKLSQHTKKAD
ncbi:putative mitochondrial protein [Apostasia shenzhenica]|uniref:Putative mitochondrial protein n=1 Tax=Apostasia shenzhenica TaxID=1088818 RepID=A0A2I0BD48_9ASPA|nr:putative mitochondrial protein [Apostasia shenzhenica]